MIMIEVLWKRVRVNPSVQVVGGCETDWWESCKGVYLVLQVINMNNLWNTVIY